MVVEVGYKDDNGKFDEEVQGTGFFLKGIGFVTNAHVVKLADEYKDLYSIQVHRSRYDSTRWDATIFKIDEQRDIAILKVDGFDDSIGFDYSLEGGPGEKITLLGYPNYHINDSLNVEPGFARQYRYHYMTKVYNPETKQLGMKQERIVISSRIVTGNSGGPVVNSENAVIGIATKGFVKLTESEKDDEIELSAIVKIHDVIELAKEVLEPV